MKTAKLRRSCGVLCGASVVASTVLGLVQNSRAQDSAPPQRLNGTKWQLVLPAWEVGPNRAVKVPVIEFKSGRVTASSGCNGMGASYTAADDGSLQIKDMMQTMMSCGPELDKLESRYSEALTTATKWELSKDRRLLMLTGPKQPLVFEPVAVKPAAATTPAQPNVSPDTPVSSGPLAPG